MTYSLAPCFGIGPFAADRIWRAKHMMPMLIELTDYHERACAPYGAILRGLGFDQHADLSLADLPYIPIGLFKQGELISVAPASIHHTLTSSGTGAAGRSRIAIDRETSVLQMRALTRIVAHFIGGQALPMLIVDAPPAMEQTADYAARLVALRGFSLFASGPPHYALTADMQLDRRAIEAFLAAHSGRPFLVFGFTHIVWTRLLAVLQDSADERIDLSGGILIHGGGWKKLSQADVDDARFRAAARDITRLGSCHNYYGMVEQPGSIYMQCDKGHFHCSCFSEILIRNVDDISVCDEDQSGLIQTVSLLPRSYPGHNLLTSDIGILRGEDDCTCGLAGKYFDVLGRAQDAPPKGCGDA